MEEKNENYKFHSEHYAGGKIEPIDFINANNYSFCQGSIVKYNHRIGKKKGEEKRDIIKIIDYALIMANNLGIEITEQDIYNAINYRLDWIKERK